TALLPAPVHISRAMRHPSGVTSHVLLTLFFYNNPFRSRLYTLSLHDALPIWPVPSASLDAERDRPALCNGEYTTGVVGANFEARDRESTRLNSSHDQISYAVFCLKKKRTRSGALCASQPRVLACQSACMHANL